MHATDPRTVKPLQKLQARMARLAEKECGDVDKRLMELNREWTLADSAKLSMGTFIAIGLIMTFLFGAWWLMVVLVAGLILLQYFCTKESWLEEAYAFCGYRTSAQIEYERLSLLLHRRTFVVPPVTLRFEISTGEQQQLELGKDHMNAQEETISIQASLTVPSVVIPVLMSGEVSSITPL